MGIVVVGAAGMVGSRVVAEAAARGHRTTAVLRRHRPGTLPDGVTAVHGDADDPEEMAALFDGASAVVAAMRPAPGREHGAVATTTTLLDAAASTGTRILVVGGAAPLELPGRPGSRTLDSPRYVPPAYRAVATASAYRAVATASAAQLEACRTHPADWTYLSPPALLEPGTRTGGYRRGTTTLLTTPDGTSHVSAEDLAVAILDELENPGHDRHFTVGY
ncbi:NAD(P)H-binding protein [Streptomyces sp. NPDC048663]|uniref:NAD(P)-dependent oxidoreductase n=1 Tax=Streptomyces sp. NPDC048663 TaxID=3155638 RepID=UPI00341F9C34